MGQPASLLCGSLCGGGVGEGTVLLPGFWRLAWHCPHFQSFHLLPIVTSTPLAVALVVVPRVGGFAYVLGVWEPFKWTVLRDWQFILLPHPPLFFIARNYKGLFSQRQNPGLHSLAWGWDCLLPRHSSCFLSPPHECGMAHSTCLASTPTVHLSAPSPPLLPIWMNMTSLAPWLSDFHTV